jgi:hypothetical protein
MVITTNRVRRWPRVTHVTLLHTLTILAVADLLYSTLLLPSLPLLLHILSYNYTQWHSHKQHQGYSVCSPSHCYVKADSDSPRGDRSDISPVFFIRCSRRISSCLIRPIQWCSAYCMSVTLYFDSCIQWWHGLTIRRLVKEHISWFLGYSGRSCTMLGLSLEWVYLSFVGFAGWQIAWECADRQNISTTTGSKG